MIFARIDYFFLVIALICVIVCTVKGFVDSFFDKAAPVLSIIASVCFFRSFTGLMSKFISNSILCSIVTFIAVFVIVFIVIKILQKTIGKIFEDNILDSLNKVLGFLFGVFEALAIIALILFLLTAQPFFDASKLLEGSFFYHIFCAILGDKFVPAWERKAAGTVTAFVSFVGCGGKLV